MYFVWPISLKLIIWEFDLYRSAPSSQKTKFFICLRLRVQNLRRNFFNFGKRLSRSVFLSRLLLFFISLFLFLFGSNSLSSLFSLFFFLLLIRFFSLFGLSYFLFFLLGFFNLFSFFLRQIHVDMINYLFKVKVHILIDGTKSKTF